MRAWASGRGAACVLACLLAACGGGGSSGPEEIGAESTDFLPTSAGNRWFYADGITRTTVRAVGPATVAGQTGDLLRTEDFNGDVTGETLIVRRADGVHAVPVRNADPLVTALGEIRLWGDTAPGARFVQVDRSVDADLDADGVPERVAVRAEVTVVDNAALTLPSGSFPRTLHLRTQTTTDFTYSSAGGGPLHTTTVEDTWYAPGVGLVRRDLAVPAFSTQTREVIGWVVDGRRSETVAPTMVSVFPAEGEVTRFGSINVTFSEPMDPVTTCAALTVTDAQGQAVAGRCQALSPRVEFVPAAPLSGTYAARLAPSATDLAGNPVGAERRWTFRIDSAGLSLVSASIADGATDVPLDAAFTLRFSEPIDPGSFAFANFTLGAQIGIGVALDARLAGDTVTLTPRAPLERNTVYTLFVPPTLTDAVGNSLEQPSGFTFTTDAGRFGPAQALLPADPALVTFLASAADVDRDGRSDVLFLTAGGTSPLARSLVVRLQRADGTLGAPVAYAGAYDNCASPEWMEVADFDGDGRIDAVIGGSQCLPLWMRQDAAGRFAPGGSIAGIGTSVARQVDLDGDGVAELLVTGSERVEVWRVVGGNWVSTAAPLPATGSTATNGLAAGDLNADGRIDIAVAVITPQGLGVSVSLQLPGGGFGAAQFTAASDLVSSRLDVADVSGDGRPDLVVTSPNVALVRAFVQQTDGSLAAPLTLALATPSVGAVAADLDGDGRSDLVTGTFGQAGVYLRRADGSLGPMRSYGRFTSTSTQMRPAVADFNGDGRPDLLVGNAILFQKATTLPDAAPRRTARWALPASALRR